VPGIGTQGGDVQAVARNGCTADGRGLLISSSRAILYAGHDADFAAAAREATLALRDSINRFRRDRA
jgi:orotidine-5'-phosphate decarboxylase